MTTRIWKKSQICGETPFLQVTVLYLACGLTLNSCFGAIFDERRKEHEIEITRRRCQCTDPTNKNQAPNQTTDDHDDPTSSPTSNCSGIGGGTPALPDHNPLPISSVHLQSSRRRIVFHSQRHRRRMQCRQHQRQKCTSMCLSHRTTQQRRLL